MFAFRDLAAQYAAATTGLQDALRLAPEERAAVPHPGEAVFGEVDADVDYRVLPAWWTYQARELTDGEIRGLLEVFKNAGR